MPQLDFNVALSNFISLVLTFVFLYIFVYFFIFSKLSKMILVRKFYQAKSMNNFLKSSFNKNKISFNNNFENIKIFNFFKKIN